MIKVLRLIGIAIGSHFCFPTWVAASQHNDPSLKLIRTVVDSLYCCAHNDTAAGASYHTSCHCSRHTWLFVEFISQELIDSL